MPHPMLALFFLLIQVCAPAPASYAEESGPIIIRALDGDSLIVKIGDSHKEIRLFGIDCPEWKQPYADQAKACSQSFAGQRVKVKSVGKDSHGRLLATIILRNGQSLNRTLVAKGLAWHYRRYCRDPVLADLEVKARKAGLGLWQDADPMPPWVWRRQKKPETYRINKKNSSRSLLHGNRKSRVFHRKTCKYYNCKNCTVIFRSRKEALSKGYRPCKLCKP
ncbi:thermonuclease family protein [Dethiosulfatarculus sandiegensis]|uniref:thermonuclease family protein n=1 Tax=Dethiosulfatarculus sandiegensis TaxID=1429043 RepID=UPI0009E83357|nr:thermonuclease family protein [Dethiosulfatarculus sandiegensis]